MPKCQSCQAPVIFVPSAKSGKPMILDARPTKAVGVGHLIYADGMQTFDPPGIQLCEDVGHGRVAQVVSVFTDHHATCPAARSWAGRTRKDPPAVEGAPV
jgi:hypothetical protein